MADMGRNQHRSRGLWVTRASGTVLSCPATMFCLFYCASPFSVPPGPSRPSLFVRLFIVRTEKAVCSRSAVCLPLPAVAAYADSPRTGLQEHVTPTVVHLTRHTTRSPSPSPGPSRGAKHRTATLRAAYPCTRDEQGSELRCTSLLRIKVCVGPLCAALSFVRQPPLPCASSVYPDNHRLALAAWLNSRMSHVKLTFSFG